jgi:hypothetical protein
VVYLVISMNHPPRILLDPLDGHTVSVGNITVKRPSSEVVVSFDGPAVSVWSISMETPSWAHVSNARSCTRGKIGS